ncbi:TetR/AcrR family transcriptional regulator [Nodularia chucula]|uniref:TetR/AcrR family transcriptional regulator n=1 Tax=Nodularia chucula TaxID=3093667 RepID=UPI0039C67586
MRVFHSTPTSEAQTRTRILQAAQKLFASKGFDGTTTRDLAQAAGVAEGTLFRHFAKLVAKVFLGMFAIAGFSNNTLMAPDASPQEMQQMAEGLADIFLNGVLAKE